MKKGHMFIINGVAGSGKSTMIKMLLEDKDLNLRLILSYKTRKPRQGEKDGIDYHYLSNEDFLDTINRGEFLEYQFVHNQDYYGTKTKDIIEPIENGENIIKELNILIWPKILKEKKINREDITFIFLDIPMELIKERMIKRGDDVNGKDYENRIESAKKERLLMHLADYVVDASVAKEEEYEKLKSIIINKI